MQHKKQPSINVFNDTFNHKFFNDINPLNKSLMSPLSVTYALMMTYLGSNGATRMELQKAFNITNETDEEILKDMTYLLHNINRNSQHIKLFLTNGVYINKNFNLHKEYQSMVKNLGSIETMDFSNNEKTVKTINDWVANNTNNLIKDLLSPSSVNPDTVMILLNTLYFKCSWKKQFKKNLIESAKFTNLLNEESETELMYMQKHFPYYEDDDYQIVEIPYKGEEFTFGILLPKKSFVLPTNVHNYFDKLKLSFLDLYFPKFTQRNKMNMKDTFRKMGVKLLFEKEADLSKISDKNIKVDDIIHEVVVIVDETGTEAAAATAVTFMTECCSVCVDEPILFKANHTFQYYIKYVPTNTLLFYGIFDG